VRRVLAEAPGATDRELLDRFARARDELAFEALVRRHGPLVLAVGRRVLGNEADADDVFQATFLLLAQKAGTVAWQGCVAGWLHRTARQLACKARDAAQRRARHERLAPAREGANPLDQITARELLGILDEELLGLPDRYRAPLVLCYLQGATRDEAARELGCPLATVKTRLERGRDRLHRALRRRGLTLSAALTAAGALSGPAEAGAPARAVVRAARALAAGQPLAEVVSTRVTRLLDGGLRAMFLSKMRVALALLAVCGVFSGVTVWVCGAGADRPEPKAAPGKLIPAAAPRAEGKDDGGKLNCAGRVLSPEGKPVGKAKVVYLRHGNDEGGGYAPVAAAIARTEANGHFRFVVLPAPEGNGPVHRGGRLLAVAPGYAPGWVKIDKPEHARDATVRLVKDDLPLEGRVVDLEGRPVAGATVRVMQLQAGEGEDLGPWSKEMAAKKPFDRTGYPNVRIDVEAMGLDRPVRTDAQGRFRIPGLGRERLAVLRFSGPTIETRDVYAMTRPGPALTGGIPGGAGAPIRVFSREHVHPSSFTHAAEPTRPVAGTVTDKATGKPVAGALVRAMLPNGRVRARPWLETTTDASGRYRLVGLPRGSGRQVTVTPEVATGYLPAGKYTPRGPDLEPARLDFALSRGVVIRGRVTDKATGKPVRARVAYYTFADNPHLKTTGAFRGGHFEAPLTGPDGRFTLVGLPGRGFVTASVPRVGDYSAQRVHYLYGVGAEEVARLGNLNGDTFPYIVSVEWTNTLAGLDLAPGKREATCDLALDPGTTLEGRIVDPQGKPVTGVRIERVGGPSDVKSVVGPTGRFTLSCVDPKRPRTYFFRHEKRKLGAVAMFKGDKVEAVTVTLQPYGALTGRFVDADGGPLAGYQVHGRLEGNQLGFKLGQLGFFHATADKAGRFRAEFLAGVRVGGYVTTDRGRRTDKWLEKITLQPGKVHDLGDVKVGPAMREE
jgi:RNA polymerase sigma factor (sigma-70 family)